MTGEQLREFAAAIVEATVSTSKKSEAECSSDRRYVFGLRGIRELFNVSHATAQRYKNTFLAPAITQRGKKIMVDADKAMQLYQDHHQI